MKTTLFRLVVLLAGGMLLSCGAEPVGPSNDKVRLDFEEVIQQSARGLVSIEDFDIDGRDVLSEDRVKVYATFTLKMGQDKVDRYLAAERESARIFGTVGGVNMRPVGTAKQMDGVTEKITLFYRFRGEGLWELRQSTIGHN